LVVALGYFAYDKFVLTETAVIPANGNVIPAQAGIQAKSIAVLPFVNMSDDASNEYFSDGISEEILNALAKVKELKSPAAPRPLLSRATTKICAKSAKPWEWRISSKARCASPATRYASRRN